MAVMQNPTAGNVGSKVTTDTRNTPTGSAGMVGSPISNDAYNVLTALQNKLEGLDAYAKYQKDGDGGIWQRISQADMQTVGLLCDELERLVREGKFRVSQPTPRT